MSTIGHHDGHTGGFTASRERFDTVLAFLDGTDAAVLSHSQLEDRLDVEGRQLLRQLLQDHLDPRALRESRVDVVDADGIPRGRVEDRAHPCAGHHLRADHADPAGLPHTWQPNLHPADAMLNLPTEKHSHGLRHLAAVESSRGSFDDAGQAISRATAQRVGQRQLEALAARSAVDFDDFYAHQSAATGEPGDVLVLSCDGKGVVMRPGALRKATAQAATKSNPKLQTRLSKGEKRNRKRMAEVGAVYDLTPVPRTPADIFGDNDDEPTNPTPTPGPALEYLWKATWCFHTEGDPAAEAWVRHHAQNILAGKATRVAGAIRRSATTAAWNPPAAPAPTPAPPT